MKKTIIISAIALCFTLATNAKTVSENNNPYQIEAVFDVSPLCASIVKGDFETVKKLVGLGVDVNEKSKGMTPAMYAARYNQVDILKYLIDHGAKLKTRSNKGLTAKKYAEISKANGAISVIENALKKD
ncbi:ankyrin repeat domain-containing protein [Lacinutrix iliipiscaria]|uniref:Ankyrin repeat domain-containing protein n=1 Tax=Lacinutrix iliipiscaria TaxID=1230532 RepID=A0ABW5WK31_9FLAO